MADKDFQDVDDPFNADIQKALAAAFGDEAADWSEVVAEDDDLLNTSGLKQSSPSSTPAVSDPSSALEELLKKVSSAIDDGVTPEMLLDGTANPSRQIYRR